MSNFAASCAFAFSKPELTALQSSLAECHFGVDVACD
jgi:hypothetical protein